MDHWQLAWCSRLGASGRAPVAPAIGLELVPPPRLRRPIRACLYLSLFRAKCIEECLKSRASEHALKEPHRKDILNVISASGLLPTARNGHLFSGVPWHLPWAAVIRQDFDNEIPCTSHDNVIPTCCGVGKVAYLSGRCPHSASISLSPSYTCPGHVLSR
ncbi:hypothetical protein BC629DRAFT_932511 [Irpex lacteus]|nr:hypothetical protein BC629DRAFT_932511 [Irpex lacteus]